MHHIHFTCTYCNHKWESQIYSKMGIDSTKCPKCKDSNLEVRDAKSRTIDTYAGAPPFASKDDTMDLEEAFKYFTESSD